MDIEFSAKRAWIRAINADGSLRDGADTAELTGMLGDLTAAGWPSGDSAELHRRRRVAVPGVRHRRPGRQLAQLEARHRARARVEDRIRCAKNQDLARMPSRQFAINTVWVERARTAADLIAWTQTMLLDGELAVAGPATLRHRLRHVAAMVTRGQRRMFVRIDSAWPWRHQQATAFTRLHALPRPIT